MKNRLTTLTNEKNADFKAAREEESFSASDLLEELAPILPDYFEGNFMQLKDRLIMLFYNGQKFALSISEV